MELSELSGLKSFVLVLIFPCVPCWSYMLTHTFGGMSAREGYVACAAHAPDADGLPLTMTSVQVACEWMVSPARDCPTWKNFAGVTFLSWMGPAGEIVGAVVEPGVTTEEAFVSENEGFGVLLPLMPHQSTAKPVPHRPAHVWPGKMKVPCICAVTVPLVCTVAVPVVSGCGFAAFAHAGTAPAICTTPAATSDAAAMISGLRCRGRRAAAMPISPPNLGPRRPRPTGRGAASAAGYISVGGC